MLILAEAWGKTQIFLENSPAPADKGVMDYSSLTARFREWKSDVKRTLEAGTSGPTEAGSPEWYTGLAVSPASFSRQLGDMQIAMLREKTVHTEMAHVNIRKSA